MSPPENPWDRDDPAWPIRETVIEWETEYFHAGYDVVEQPDGEEANYYWLQPNDAVIVVAVTDDDEVVVVEQYRPRMQMDALGFPAGAIEDDEDADAAARRELREETGYDAGRVTYVDTYVPSGWTRYVRHVYFADDLTEGEQDLDDGEFITVDTIPVDELVGRAHAREGPVNGGVLTPFLVVREAGLV